MARQFSAAAVLAALLLGELRAGGAGPAASAHHGMQFAALQSP